MSVCTLCSCLLWQYPVLSVSGSEIGNRWDTAECSPQTHFVMQQDFVQCACSQLGDMAVSIDLAQGYGWTLPAGLSAVVCILALLMSIALHFIYLSRTQLASRLLICLCIAVLAYQVNLLLLLAKRVILISRLCLCTVRSTQLCSTCIDVYNY